MNFERLAPLTLQELEAALANTKNARVGLIGDLCLDMYWLADMTQSQLSRETPHYPLPVVEERFSPGGAGNVACNLAALLPRSLQVFGVVGDDWRGALLLEALESQNISTDKILRQPGILTNTYIKPLRKGISAVVYEDPRLDFENRKPLPKEAESRLLQLLEESASGLDVLCVSDQMESGCITPAVRECLCKLGKAGLTVIVDSRDRAGLYENVILKPNEVEAARLFGMPVRDLQEAARACYALWERTKRTAIITLGDQGSMLCSEGKCFHSPACTVEPPIDFCGAGDTFLSGFGTFLAAGADPFTAIRMANLCSAITIQKIGTTGTASPEELRALCQKAPAE